MIAPEVLYLNDPECLVTVFDVRDPDAAAALTGNVCAGVNTPTWRA